MRLILFIANFLVLISGMAFGQADKCQKSTEGKEFWFGFMEGRNYQKSPIDPIYKVGHYCEITLSSNYDCTYQIFIGKSATATSSGAVTPNIPVKVLIDWLLVEAIGSEAVQDKAIHLISDNPLNVYALNWSDASSEVAMIFPKESLGSEYYSMCYTPHINGNGINSGSGRNSEFMIVASEDNTTVTITPSKITHLLKPANIPFEVILNKGELYQVQSENLIGTGAQGQGDLTGSYIISDKPVAFYSGSLSTTVPYGTNVSAWDHLFEQIPPLQTWGRKFITVPLSTRHEDTYRILAAENNTMVRIGNNPPVTLQKGIYHEFSLLYTEPSLIESDKPILLAQFSNSNTVDRAWTSGDGDPFMVIVSPVNQTREKVSFVAYESPRINSKYFINVVVKDDAVGAIKLDNTIVIFNAVTGSGYSYAQVPLTKGNHYIESTVAGKGFIAYVYGFGGVEAYGYGVGYNLDIVLDLGSNINADGNKLLIRCEGSDSLVLSAGNAFDTYKWNTDATTSEIKISDAGWYKVEVATRSGCALKDSVELQISKPVVDLGIDHTVCNPNKDTLNAGNQFTSYSWSTKETSQKITISNSDKYSVLATNKYGCIASDSIIVSFVDKPKIDFSRIDTLICGQKSALLNISADKGVFSSQRLTDAFSFTGNNISVPEFGAYPFRIKATDEFSCFSDSLIHFGFRKTPTVDFSIDSTKCQGYNLDIQYLGDANISGSDFAWIFGGDTIVHGLGIDAYLVPLGVNRAKRDLKLTVTDEGCPNSKMIADIKVTPTLQLGIENNLGCEPLTSKLIANNTETVRYDWTFGDGSELNGPSSQPTHTYQNAGYFTVKLKVTTDKGCTNQVEIDSMVHVVPIPTVGFTQLPAQCLDIGNHLIGYSGTGDLQATYYWDLSGFDKEEVIANPGQTQGPFVFDLKNKPQANIGLRVTSKYGCQSDTAVLLVKRKPDLTINASILEACTPFSTTLTGSTTDPVDQVNYTWDFGDGKSGSNANALHEYSSPGQTYDVGLTALSSLTGCSNTIVRKALIRTYPKPVASFSMDHNIVYNDLPDVAFTDKSIGATDYYWDFGDKTTSVLPSPLHHFVKMGHMKVLLEVANEYMCTDTTSQNVLVAFDRLFPPNAFSPNSPNPVDREFKLGSEGMNTEGYYFRILTRWNDVVFEARNEFKGWNGQMANGSYALPGVYLWLLEYSDFLGRRHKQTGTVTLIY